MKIYQVDAFTNEKFKGNPACVCVLPEGYIAAEEWMQALAAEMNLSETAFVQAQPDGVFSLRWFTPTTEVDLCGHATLATSHILWQQGLLSKTKPALFDTLSGRLTVNLIGSLMEMNFPVAPLKPCKQPVGLEMALGAPAVATYEAGLDLLVELENEDSVANLQPSIQQIAQIPVRCVIVTALANKNTQVDFVSRVFGPQVGIDEDPVTGSVHCSLAPYWAEKLAKTKMKARQISQRGGDLSVELLGDRVNVSGEAITVFSGELND